MLAVRGDPTSWTLPARRALRNEVSIFNVFEARCKICINHSCNYSYRNKHICTPALVLLFEGKNVKEWWEILYQERTGWVQWLWIPIPSNTMTTRDHGRCSWGSQEEEQRRLENAEDGCRALSENRIRFCNYLLPIPPPNRRIQQPKHSDIPIEKRLLSNQKVYIRNLQSQKRGAVTAKASLWPLSVCPLLV